MIGRRPCGHDHPAGPPDPAVVAEAMAATQAALAPMLDAADGMRADLERRGWSPTMAEALAGQYLANLLGGALGARP